MPWPCFSVTLVEMNILAATNGPQRFRVHLFHLREGKTGLFYIKLLLLFEKQTAGETRKVERYSLL